MCIYTCMYERQWVEEWVLLWAELCIPPNSHVEVLPSVLQNVTLLGVREFKGIIKLKVK